MNSVGEYILFLPSWYPGKLSPFNGDFIKRHAEAISLYEKVHVIYVEKDKTGNYTKNILTEKRTTGNLSETIIYYYSPKVVFSFLDRLLSHYQYKKIYKKAIGEYIKENGLPSLVHVHVGMKAGIIARWVKEKFKCRYVITEHWTGFLENAHEQIQQLPFYLKGLWKKVYANAAAVSAVSNTLAKDIKRTYSFTEPIVIPNVVDITIFNEPRTDYTPAKFIHISGLDEFKNPYQLLNAFNIVLEKYKDAKLEIVGSTKTEVVKYANELGLQNRVSFSTEIPQAELVKHIREAVALILYSKYETFGCVIIEANAAGVPVIVSDIPVFHETVQDGVNGYFAAANNPAALAEKMIAIINNRSSFNSEAISQMTGLKYSYLVVGQQFSDWYKSILNSPSV